MQKAYGGGSREEMLSSVYSRSLKQGCGGAAPLKL